MPPSTIIIGGTGGIGSALARKLAAQGVRLHLVARNKENLAALGAETGATTAVADVARPEELTAAIAAAGDAVNGLVYAVGTINLKPVGKLAEAEIEHDFRLNALGAFTAIRAALPALKLAETTSSIVLFSSIVVSQGLPAHASVAMAKGAVEGLTLALAAEFAPKIRVNCIAPSLTRTNLAKAFTQNEPMAAAIAALHPLGRLGEPQDIAALAAFLLSEEAGWMTGQIIGVDGGRSTLRGKG